MVAYQWKAGSPCGFWQGFQQLCAFKTAFVAARAGGGEGVTWDYGWIHECSDIFCLRQKSIAVRCGLFVQDCLQRHPELLGLSWPYSTGVDVNGKPRADAGLHHLQRNGISAGGF